MLSVDRPLPIRRNRRILPVEEYFLNRVFRMSFDLSVYLNSPIGSVEYPRVTDAEAIVRADCHASIKSAESVRAIERDVAPLCVEAVDPVIASERVGETYGEGVEA